MLVLPRLFHVPCQQAYAKQSFNLARKSDRFNRQRTRLCNSLTPLFANVPVPWHRKGGPCSESPLKWSTLPSQLNENIGVCVIFHMELCFQLHHTSSRECYNTILRDFIDYKFEVLEWFCPSGLSKTSHGNQHVGDWALGMGGSRLFRVTDLRARTMNAVAKMPSRWLGKKQAILQNMPISYSQINYQSFYVSYNLTECVRITI